MMQILYRPMVKEALVLITSGILATAICSRVYAASVSETEQPAAPAIAAAAPAPALQYQLAPVPQDQAREMLLAAVRGQTALVGPLR
jgi:hypothetical protein